MRNAATTLMALGLIACAEPPDEPASTAGASTANGYTHLFSHSRFAIGPTVTETKSEFGMDKVIGPWGVFATIQKTGSVLALPNADAPSRARPPLPGGAEAHNAEVRSYFVGAGLPAAEIDKVTVNTTASAGGSGTETPEWTLVAYTSVLSRHYKAIPIVDSFAWAQVNDLRDVVTESVYWPEIPKSILTEASAFADQLEDPASSQAFFASVPTGGRLVIHHTPGTWTGTFEASVAYDISTFGKTTHYDADGKKFVLPEESGAP